MAKAYVEIPLTKGKVALVDVEDAERVIAAGPWSALDVSGGDEHWYATGKGLTYMHRFILDTPKGKHTDHINGDGLDNRRENLRVVTPKQNSANSGARKGNRYKGVSRRGGKWDARIQSTGSIEGRGRRLWSGTYDTEEEAARARDAAVRTGLYREPDHERYNFPEVGERGLDGEIRTI